MNIKESLKNLRDFWRKYWLRITIAVFLIITLCFAILVEVYRLQGCWIALRIFDFLSSWAIILYASITLLLAGVAFWSVIETRSERLEARRIKALERIRDWAEEIIAILKRTSEEEQFEKEQAKLCSLLDHPRSKGFSILCDSQKIGGRLFERTGNACFLFREYTLKASKGSYVILKVRG